MNIDFALTLTACVLFVLAAANVSTGRLTAAGLACLALTLLV